MNADRIFYSDSLTGRTVTYRQFVDDLNGCGTYAPYCKSADYYAVFRELALSLLSGREITLLDAGFTEAETAALAGGAEADGREPLPRMAAVSVSDLPGRLAAGSETWRVTLFTSGTTGRPKKVRHTFASVTRQVRTGARHAGDVWGFAYDPAHMAGLQVFFQALLNGNSVIRLSGLGAKAVAVEINGKGVTHISATPTFYRLLLPPSGVCPSVVRLTSGGEKFDGRTLRQLRALFPNARVTNVYASMEAGSLFASRGLDFVLKDDMRGKARVEGGELLLHKSLLGESASAPLDGDWYHTGDLAEVSCAEPLTFRLVSRKTEMINVGGYKVNPTEVEERLRECAGVRDAFVYAREIRVTGSLIMADVVRDGTAADERGIREQLRAGLQEFKIPRVIRFVPHLNMTRAGKMSRR